MMDVETEDAPRRGDVLSAAEGDCVIGDGVRRIFTVVWDGLCRGAVGVTLFILDIPFFTPVRRIPPDEIGRIARVIRPGDVVITADRLFPAWQLLIKSVGRSNYTHAAIYEGEGRVIEATTFHPSGDGVARTPLEKYIRGHKVVCVLRPPYADRERLRAALGYAEGQLGKRYEFRTSLQQEGTMYCTKLVARALEAAGLRVGGIRILERPYYVPDDFLRIGRMVFVHGGRFRFRRTMRAHLPLLAVLALFPVLAMSGTLGAAAAWAGIGATLVVAILLGLVQLKTRFL